MRQTVKYAQNKARRSPWVHFRAEGRHPNTTQATYAKRAGGMGVVTLSKQCA
jgi:hypothetical protein